MALLIMLLIKLQTRLCFLTYSLFHKNTQLRKNEGYLQ